MGTTVIVERDVMVEMRDGVALATDVYRPADGAPVPVLVERTPYDKSFAWFTAGLILNPLVAVERGFAVVVQDVRGRGGSGGEWVPFVHEADDGYDAIEWAAAEEWCDGRAGVFGSSYLGVTSLQATVAAPPSLRAAVAYLTGANYREGWTYSGGVFELGFNLWWTSFLAWDTWARSGADPAVLADLSEVATRWDAVARGSADDVPGFAAAAPYWRRWRESAPDDELWTSTDVTRRAREITVPVLHVAGWYDNFLRGHLDLQAALGDGDPSVRDAHRLVIGPWDHESYLSVRPTAAGEREFGPSALGGVNMMSALALDWFDRWLKDGDATDHAPVRYFSTGDDRWIECESWPPPASPLALHLRSGGGANGRAGDGVLAETPGPEDPPDTIHHDPSDPVPTTGGRTLAPIFGPGGVRDQSRVEERADVLVYTGPALVEPLRLAGPVNATIHVACDHSVAHVCAKLVDVEPDGTCANIAEGIRSVEAAPGTITPAHVELLDVAHVFAPGHRVRLDVAASNHPRFETAPGPSTVQVHHDEAHPSRVALPRIRAS